MRAARQGTAVSSVRWTYPKSSCGKVAEAVKVTAYQHRAARSGLPEAFRSSCGLLPRHGSLTKRVRRGTRAARPAAEWRWTGDRINGARFPVGALRDLPAALWHLTCIARLPGNPTLVTRGRNFPESRVGRGAMLRRYGFCYERSASLGPQHCFSNPQSVAVRVAPANSWAQIRGRDWPARRRRSRLLPRRQADGRRCPLGPREQGLWISHLTILKG